MKFIDQTIFEKGKGDCFRSCMASIFEFDIDYMPNFWDMTDESPKFWSLVNAWTIKNLKCKCLPICLNKNMPDIIDDLLCIAIGNTKGSDEEHAVVWCNRLIHDPHPSRKGLISNPKVYVILIPMTPNEQLNLTQSATPDSAS